MRKFITAERQQPYLLPPDLCDWLPDGHLAHFVLEIVDQLDLDCILCTYGEQGSPPYHPKMMVPLLFYSYATGIFSSRKMESATYENIPIRVITGNQHPDHDTINNFRLQFLPQLDDLFVQIIRIAKEMGVLKLGNIAIDGTKIHADASKHKAMSYKRILALEQKINDEVKTLLEKAEAADALDKSLPNLDIPKELELRQNRLQKLAEAKAAIEQRAKERAAIEQEEYENKLKARAEKEAATGKKPHGKAPTPPEASPKPTDQYNFTDPESRIMKGGSGKNWEQSYNAQAAVDTDTMLIVGNSLSHHCNDKAELKPVVESIPQHVYRVDTASLDNGYFSEKNIQYCEDNNIDPYIAVGRDQHNQWLANKLAEPLEKPASNAKPSVNMAYKLKTAKGKSIYGKRKETVEPVFGIIKEVMGFRQFSLRTEEKTSGEWNLVCIAYNLKRLFSIKMGKGLPKNVGKPKNKRNSPKNNQLELIFFTILYRKSA